MKKCITYQTEPKHVVIMNARNEATAFLVVIVGRTTYL